MDGGPNNPNGTETAADPDRTGECYEAPPSQQANKDKMTKSSSGKRPLCPRCTRPLRVCICPALPDDPVRFRRCRVVVLQHPHEGRRKNRSVPLVELCVAGGGGGCGGGRSGDGSDDGDGGGGESSSTSDFHLRTIVHRRLGDEVDPAIMELINDPDGDVMLVYPGRDSVSLAEGLAELDRRRLERAQRTEAARTAASGTAADSANQGGCGEEKLTLLFLDATWKYAQEMERKNTAGKWWPDDLIRVKLSPGRSSEDGAAGSAEGVDTSDNAPKDDGNDSMEQQLIQHQFQQKDPGTGMVVADQPKGYRPRRFDIRTPPTSQHLSTAECIAWVVSAVEEDPSIYRTLMNPLDLMVEKWKSFSDDDGRGGGSRGCRGRRGFTDGDGLMEEAGNGVGDNHGHDDGGRGVMRGGGRRCGRGGAGVDGRKRRRRK